ncbi:DUF1990 family protein [Amycolatopsis jiangsuensis]|uniref:DUF1990 domain-containing protein n=1 Tax=Amycolatopsis jiangsuensis TaxID=1181879 RepID=A0A840ILT5_9PSEU|nr:DUF1990 family protein [Amycolatopsis jiangsuensis]MBB4683311.1 hypothetical protein [Amycolatopsis jiangsuensis]
MSAGFMLSPPLRTLVRWPAGLLLVSWRYLWMTTPLHRSEQCGDAGDLPPSLPDSLVDHRSLPATAGTGALWHRVFEVCVVDSALGPEDLIARMSSDLNAAAPTEAAVFDQLAGPGPPLRVGAEYVVRMAAPWDGPVRVVEVTGSSFRLATLAGHLEAGQVEFRARSAGHGLVFTVETWHRCASRLVDLLYTRLRLAKEIQLNMWVRYCVGAARVAGGQLHGGVRITTRRLDGAGLRQPGSRERAGS